MKKILVTIILLSILACGLWAVAYADGNTQNTQTLSNLIGKVSWL